MNAAREKIPGALKNYSKEVSGSFWKFLEVSVKSNNYSDIFEINEN